MGFGISTHPVGVVVAGLDYSGKTTLVNWLAGNSSQSDANSTGDVSATYPTVGFNARRLKFGKTPLSVLDMSGQGRYRNLWLYYLRQCEGIVYVVDCSDCARLPVAFAELQRLLSDDALIRRRPHLPVLVLANKADCPASSGNFRRFNAALRTRCRETRRPCHMVASCALTGEGLIHGFEWLLRQVDASGTRWRQEPKPTWY